MPKKKTAEEFDALFSGNPSKLVIEIQNYEQWHRLKVLSEFKGYLKYFEDSFDLLCKSVELVNYSRNKHVKNENSLQLLIIARNLPNLYAAFYDNISGHYQASATIYRSAYEILGRLAFISYYPDDSYSAVLDPSDVKRSGLKTDGSKPRPFNFTQTIYDLGGVEMKKLYKIICQVAHSNSLFTALEAMKMARDGNKKAIGLEMAFDKDQFSIPINFSIFINLCLLLFIRNIYFKNLRLDKNYRKRLDNTMRGLEIYIKSLPTPSYKNAYKEFVDITTECVKKQRLVS